MNRSFSPSKLWYCANTWQSKEMYSVVVIIFEFAWHACIPMTRNCRHWTCACKFHRTNVCWSSYRKKTLLQITSRVLHSTNYNNIDFQNWTGEHGCTAQTHVSPISFWWSRLWLTHAHETQYETYSDDNNFNTSSPPASHSSGISVRTRASILGSRETGLLVPSTQTHNADRECNASAYTVKEICTNTMSGLQDTPNEKRRSNLVQKGIDVATDWCASWQLVVHQNFSTMRASWEQWWCSTFISFAGRQVHTGLCLSPPQQKK